MDKELSTSVLKRIVCMLIIAIILLNANLPVQAATNESYSISKFITVGNKEMHIVLYGELDQNGGTFADQRKEILVMLPALAVPSPNIYFKPLAEALDSVYNVVVIEPFGYGLSDTTESVRTIENISSELYEAINVLDIDTCTLLVHSIAGIYGLHFLYAYTEKVNGIISMDNTVYTEELSEALLLEQEYMLLETEEFNALRNTFNSTAEFETAIAADPAQYGAEVPDIVGYTYSESDMEEYYKAYANSSNQTIQNEILNMDENLESIKGVKFPSTLPVLMLVSSDNIQSMPVWKTAHEEQLDFSTGKHQLHIVEGSHYIWYTNLLNIVKYVLQWNH